MQGRLQLHSSLRQFGKAQLIFSLNGKANGSGDQARLQRSMSLCLQKGNCKLGGNPGERITMGESELRIPGPGASKLMRLDSNPITKRKIF
jgi:hypothetical protein